MTESTVELHSLFSDLAGGLTLVTGNSRLARVLSIHYGQWRLEQGDSMWQSPDLLSWNAWLGRLWELAGLQGVQGTELAIPGNHQLINLWERTLRGDARARQLLRPDSLAARLRETRKLCVDWLVDMSHPAWHGEENENHAAFSHWNRTFEALCQRENWLPPEDRLALLVTTVRGGELKPPARIGLMGFDEFNPAQKDLLAALEDTGVQTEHISLAPARGTAKLWQSQDSRHELQSVARWVRHWSEREPRSRIAVIVPDLHSRRLEVEHHLAEILTPAIGNGVGKAKPWNISMGKPLIQVPMIEAAFDLLSWLEKRIDIQDIGRVLRSPWFSGGSAEQNSRALLEKCLRENYPRQLKLNEVRYRAGEIRKYDNERQELPTDQQEPQPWNSPILVSVINQLSRFERDSRGKLPPSAWAEAIDGLLAKSGWHTTAETAGDDGWQIIQAWKDALRGLASLDATTRRLSRKAAIAQLQQICREQVFQARTPPANIQVLGLYEVSGLRFDHLWVLGLHNDNWPPAAQPNPFIPGVLQNKAQLPQSSPQRELEVARTITERLLHTAPDCIFSYPGQLDGETVLPSPLLSGKPFKSETRVPGWQEDHWQALVHAAGPPQQDPLSMPGPPAPGTAKGGSSILKHQALCPFRAFAVNRLGAKGLETPVDGISPALHGSLIHRVLEEFWRQTRTQQALKALDAKALRSRVRLHVERVVGEERSLIDRPEFREVESGRLQRLIATQLGLESKRQPFEVVGFERELLQEIEGQQIRLVIDRIDRLPSGEEVIIDYKTGKVQPSKWFGDRPDDPQLPLYATSTDRTPAAVVFSVIRDDECVYKGVTTEDGIFPGLPPRHGSTAPLLREAGNNMSETIGQWREILHRLMADFLLGEARIDPKDGMRTCDNSYCDLHALCRIHELEGSP
jgi:probable DNA repair protein